MNTSALSSISTTIAGSAFFLSPGTPEEKWAKETHLANNTFGDQAREEHGLFGAGNLPEQHARECAGYGVGDDVRVVVVPVREGRIADWKGGVKDWRVVVEEEAGAVRGVANEDGDAGRGRSMVNGVV
jgi:hypothetical protein